MQVAHKAVKRRTGCLQRSVLPKVAGSRCFSGKTSTYDVVIIGGGIVGNACAYELRKKGYTTCNVDRLPSPGYGSTSSSSSILRSFYSLEETCRLSWESYHIWENWGDYVGASADEDICTVREVGVAALITPASSHCLSYIRNVSKALDACGVPYQHWDLAELERRMPYISTASFYPPRRIDDEKFGEENGQQLSGALFSEKAGYVNDPQLAARNIADAAKRLGGDFCWNAKVSSISLDPTGRKVRGVVLDDGAVINTNIIINAAGPHSPIIHDLAFSSANVSDDSKIGSKAMKVEVAYLLKPSEVSDCAHEMPIVADFDSGVYMRPQQGGQLVIGSVEPECDKLEFLGSADDVPLSVSDVWTNTVYRTALRLPSLRIPTTSPGLVSMYDTTPDWVPIYDKSSLGGFYSMRGTSGNQFKMAPVVGKIGAELVDGCENGRDHDTNPLTLNMTEVSGTVCLDLFSRLRSVATTSGSVFA